MSWKSIKIRRETHQYFMNEVKNTFLREHPEFMGTHLSFNFLLEKAARYYVEH